MMASMSGSAMPPTGTTVAMAMQRSPAEPYTAETAASAAMPMSASGRTIMWFFAPARAWTFFPCAAAVAYTYFAMGVEPTKESARMSGCSRMRSTTTLSPCTTWNTPSGRPASRKASASMMEAPGSRSEGFRMKQLPQAMAAAHIHIGTMAGKLNGVIPATTPMGWRTEKRSYPVVTCSL
ncbi:hypothetical protein HRbin12_01868 [bacterium HR12]|nr:hypothetical protein HRbin12_01868 [bacterium HR12]